MENRRNIKRVYRVPKDRGALEYLASLIVKKMVQHGWPVTYRIIPFSGAVIEHVDQRGDLPQDIQCALDIAARIIQRTYRVEFTQDYNWFALNRVYAITQGGFFRETSDDLSRQGSNSS